jgi:hypothetical protein
VRAENWKLRKTSIAESRTISGDHRASERNQELETEISKVARVGKRRKWISLTKRERGQGFPSAKSSPKNGDFILAYRDAERCASEPRMLVDNKDKSVISESDIDKLVRDATERSIPCR